MSKSFIVTVSVAGVEQTQVWDSEKPFQIGHPIRWVMEQTPTGVQVRNFGDEALAPIGKLGSDALKKSATMDLLDQPKGKKSGFKLTLVPVEILPPAYLTHEGQGELRIYPCVGDWAKNSIVLNDSFEAHSQNKRVFRLKKLTDGKFSLLSYTDDLVFVSEKGIGKELAPNQALSFTADQLSGSSLELSDLKWRLEALRRVDKPADLAPTEISSEALTFKKAFKSAMIALAALFLLAIMWPHSKEEAVTPAQVTKIVLTHRKAGLMTAAAQGHSSAHDNQTGHAAHPKAKGEPRLAVNHHHNTSVKPSGKPKAPAKAVAKGAVKSPARPKKLAKTQKQSVAPTQVAHAKPVKKSSGLALATKHKLAPVVINDQAFRAATRGLVGGGTSHALLGSASSAGSSARAEARAIVNGGGTLGGSNGGESGSLSAHSAEVAALGGNSESGGSALGYGRGSHAAVAGQGHSVVSMDTGASDVEEGLTKDQVGAVIHSHMSEIRYCYEAAMLRSPDVEGKLGLKFVIGAPGSVKKTGRSDSTLADSKINDCVMRRLVTWHFPHTRGGVDVAVNYPLIFKTLGR